MTPWLRKLALTAHVSSSVGWLGAVAAFLALALTSLYSARIDAIHCADVAMALTAGFVIVPLCVASLLTGIVQSLGTPWGLFRYHWVIAKLFITIVSTLILWLHMRPIALLGASSIAQTLSADLHAIRVQVAVDAAAALCALLLATALGVLKPKGTTRFGARGQLVKAA